MLSPCFFPDDCYKIKPKLTPEMLPSPWWGRAWVEGEIMSSVQTPYEHIILDEKGSPVITGTTMKVVELIVEKLAHGWSAEELCFQHPYLTLGQIYSALAYYADHQAELERDIEDRLKLSMRLEKETGISSLIERLKSQGLI